MPNTATDTAARQRWMAILARASLEELQQINEAHTGSAGHQLPRPTETGLAMLRGRIGGTGKRFNVGEMTVTRCVVQLQDRTTGVAYILGRDRRKAELAAVLDARLQNGDLDQDALAPITARQESERAERAEAVASTKVDFFTMVRGED